MSKLARMSSSCNKQQPDRAPARRGKLNQNCCPGWPGTSKFGVRTSFRSCSGACSQALSYRRLKEHAGEPGCRDECCWWRYLEREADLHICAQRLMHLGDMFLLKGSTSTWWMPRSCGGQKAPGTCARRILKRTMALAS